MAKKGIRRLKIIQVNAWKGYLIHSLMNFIAAEKPDILCCQEVLSSSQPNLLFHIFQNLEDLKEAGGFEFCFFSPTSTFDAFSAKVDVGNAIFSKVPFINQQTIFINDEYDPNQTVLDFRFNITNLQICELQMPKNNNFTVANYHGYHNHNPLGTAKTIECSKKVADALKPYKKSLLLAGDFNISTKSPAFKPLSSLALENPITLNGIETTLSKVHRISTIKKVACDYIMHSSNIKLRKFSLADEVVSDHKALVLEFDL
jgi:endonuclease/exonuclease/phosphatase family metal-dependent hydrolase